ncbi:MAG: methyltransferase, RsmE family [Thermoleophilia bacterium]|nr:methyltransferase, RsmE family [Thermoleophilia bacterium]
MSDVSAGDSHVFRFFVDVVGAAGDVVPLDAADAAHARVLRMSVGDAVEVADAAEVTWSARVHDASSVQLVKAVPAAARPAVIELIAGALVGGKFDELVDGAVQAGATRIVPLVASRRDHERLTSRRSRLERIARAAAKQAKRPLVPEIADPIDHAGLLALEPGVLLDAGAPTTLDVVLASRRAALPRADAADVRLLVGPADGLPAELVAELLERGWEPARLGPSILRAELAAAVAVAIAALRD